MSSGVIHGSRGISRTLLILEALYPAVQQVKNLFPYAPLVYSIFTAAILLGLILWTVIQLARPFSPEHAARYVEQQQPKLRNNLINSLQLYPQMASAQAAPGFSAPMVLALLRTTRKEVSGLKLNDLLDTRRLK